MNDNINSSVEATSFASIKNICKTMMKFRIIARTVKECITIANFFVKLKNWVVVPAQVGRRDNLYNLPPFRSKWSHPRRIPRC
jgi:hypothetical protein